MVRHSLEYWLTSLNFYLSFLLHLKDNQNSDENAGLSNFQGKMLKKATGLLSKQWSFTWWSGWVCYPNGKLGEKAIRSCWKCFCLGPLDVRQNKEFTLPDLGGISSWHKGLLQTYQSTWGREVETNSQSLNWPTLQNCVWHLLFKLSLHFSVRWALPLWMLKLDIVGTEHLLDKTTLLEGLQTLLILFGF